MSIESLNDCIESGECRATFFRLSGCGHCDDMRGKLDRIGVEYDEQEIDESVLDEFDRRTVPFLRVRDGDGDAVFENEDIETLRGKLSRIKT